MKDEWLDNTPDLLKHLEDKWPNELPKVTSTNIELAELIGQQQVIDYIRRNLKQKEK